MSIKCYIKKGEKRNSTHDTLLAISKLLSLGNVLQKSLEIKLTADIIIAKVCKNII